MNEYFEQHIAKDITNIAIGYLSKEFSFAQLTDPDNKEIIDQYVQFVFDRYFQILAQVEKKINPN